MATLNEKDVVSKIQPLEIYKNFIPEDMLDSYTRLRWIRKYNALNRFELTTPFNKQLFNTLTSGTGLTSSGSDYFDVSEINTVIYKDDVNEACFVEDINVYTDVFGQRKMTVRGSGVEKLIGRRVTTMTKTDTVQNIVLTLLNNNIITPSDSLRTIEEFVIGSIDIETNPTSKVDYQTRTSCLTILDDLLQPENIGYRVLMDMKRKLYVFELYEGKYDPYIVYDRNFNNVSEEDWYILSSTYSNLIYVGSTPIGSAYGINRREYAISSVSGESTSITGERILRERERTRSANVQIDETNNTFYYLQDWNLGDIITFANEDLNTEILQNVLEVHEFYEAGKVKIDVVFGDYIPIRG